MKSSHRIRRMQRMNRMRSRAVHLNLVSMIDVFAVLVFFLLLSASLAADRLNALGLDLPSPDAPQEQQPPPQKIVTVTIRKSELELSDLQGVVTHIPNTAEGRDLKTLATRLSEIKLGKPKEEQITLLMEPDVAYEVLVQVMDAARTLPVGVQLENNSTRDMFPLISIGDAPETAGGAP